MVRERDGRAFRPREPSRYHKKEEKMKKRYYVVKIAKDKWAIFTNVDRKSVAAFTKEEEALKYAFHANR